jgi:hypothetical protein
MDNVSLFKQQLCEVAAVLSANACSNSRVGRVRLDLRPLSPSNISHYVYDAHTRNQGNLATLSVRHGAELYFKQLVLLTGCT